MSRTAPGGAPGWIGLLESIDLGRSRARHSNDVGAALCRAIRTVGELFISDRIRARTPGNQALR
jgi:hypothetical protein